MKGSRRYIDHSIGYRREILWSGTYANQLSLRIFGVLLPPQLASRLTSNTANRPLEKLSFIRVAFIENHLFRRRRSLVIGTMLLRVSLCSETWPKVLPVCPVRPLTNQPFTHDDPKVVRATSEI